MEHDGGIRLIQVELQDFMNIGYGKIQFPCAIKLNEAMEHGDILGIYGQNGSGKSAFIHSLMVLKKCLSGVQLPDYATEYVAYGKESSNLYFQFISDINGKMIEIYYELTLSTYYNEEEDKKNAFISQESIHYRLDGRRKTVLMASSIIGLRPKKIVEAIKKANPDIDGDIEIRVAKGIVNRQCKSFLFSRELLKLMPVNASDDEYIIYNHQITALLQRYGRELLYVMGTEDIGLINLSLLQPFHFHIQNSRQASLGTLAIPINRSQVFFEREFSIVTKFISDVNIVLAYLIPDLQIELRNLGKELDDKGNSVIRSELVSIRDNKVIPIRFESEGIKKILSILHVFIGAYNNPSMTIAIDELDSGIYEYLFGEILSVFCEAGKGQLIFTSHNLRPLEVLDKKSIVFTTTNPENRYIRLTNVKPNNNLRDFYYRVIQLGGEKERLYEETDRYELDLALRKAGRHGEK